METAISESSSPRPTGRRSGGILQQKWVFAATLLFSSLVLLRAQHFFGTIYRGWDTQFYYSLARSIVHDHDLDITNDLELSPAPDAFDLVGDGGAKAPFRLADGRIPSKYPIGLTLLEIPLVAVAAGVRQAVTAVGAAPRGAPGYSTLELWIVALGLLALHSYGLSELFAFLSKEFGARIASFGLVGAWAGTSLFYYSAVFPFMAHGCAFTLLTLTLRASDPARTIGTNRRLATLGILVASLFLVRPQQLLIGLFLLPLAWGWCRQKRVEEWLPGAALALAVGAAAVALAGWANHAQYGASSISGYANEDEGFPFLLRPQLAFVLFSASRGLFVFSPIVLVALAGLAAGRRLVPRNVWAHALNFVAQVYVVAAWSRPDQGDAFGPRMLSDNSAVVGIGLAVLLYAAPRGNRLVEAVIGGCCLWTAYLMALYMNVRVPGIT